MKSTATYPDADTVNQLSGYGSGYEDEEEEDGTDGVVPLTDAEVASIRALRGQWLSIARVSDLAHKSDQTLQRWVRAGLFDPDDHVNDGQFNLYSKERVIALLPIMRSKRAKALLREQKIAEAKARSK